MAMTETYPQESLIFDTQRGTQDAQETPLDSADTLPELRDETKARPHTFDCSAKSSWLESFEFYPDEQVINNADTHHL